MELKRILLDQLEREAAASRKAVERVPDGHGHWKPHEKSMEFGKLAALVATMPSWPWLMVTTDVLDLEAPESDEFKTKPLETRAEMLEAWETSLAKSRKALQETTDEHLLTHWKLVLGAQTISDEPRYVAILNGALSHAAHHRGQLTVYLRLLEASVPAIYGPSADEWQ